jgi:hypothetical protein
MRALVELLLLPLRAYSRVWMLLLLLRPNRPPK